HPTPKSNCGLGLRAPRRKIGIPLFAADQLRSSAAPLGMTKIREHGRSVAALSPAGATPTTGVCWAARYRGAKLHPASAKATQPKGTKRPPQQFANAPLAGEQAVGTRMEAQVLQCITQRQSGKLLDTCYRSS